MTSYSRHEVLRILQIGSRQLNGWERAGLIEQKQCYTFQDLGQLRTLRALRQEDVSAASIRNSIVAMKAVAGMTNPLVEARLVRTTGSRIGFRYHGAIVDPIRRQLFFDFDRLECPEAISSPTPLRYPDFNDPQLVQDRFLDAVQAEEEGEREQAVTLYHEILTLDPTYAPAFINLGTIHFHLRQFDMAEEFYRCATKADPTYVLAFFDLGNALDELQRFDESIAAYRQAIALAPRYADAHYNIALAYEHRGQYRLALRHWESYLRLDGSGLWAEHARGQIRLLLNRDKLSIAWRTNRFLAPSKEKALLELVSDPPVLSKERVHPPSAV